MRKVICEHGHFYDGDKYDQCPTCKNIQESRQNAPVAGGSDQGEEKKGSKKKGAEGKKGLFGRYKSSEVVHTLPLPPEETDTEEMQPVEAPQEQQIKREHNGTLALWQLEEQQEETSFASEIEAAKMMAAAEEPEIKPEPEVNVEPEVKPEPAREEPLKPAQDLSSGKTVAFYGMEDDPATGFLICIKGAAKGSSYPLKTGQNFIGRGLNMDVILNQEPSVSRSKHAVILYEPKKREFYLQPGESSGLTYLNDDLIMGFNKLSAYDHIQVGECVLTFLPFCGEKFSWDDEE